MTTRAILTYENANNEQEIRFFKTIEEARQRIEYLCSLRNGYHNFKIKVIKPT